MNRSASALISCSCVIALLAPCHAEEEKSYTYHFSVAGVVCSACSKVVKDCIRKVDGVTSVNIRKNATGELPTLTVESTSPTLDAAALQAALGATSGHYQILPPAARP
jgi:copper chaperone CopZ